MSQDAKGARKMETMRKFLGIFSPVLLSFGPIFMVMGTVGSSTMSMFAILAYGGAVSLGLGLVVLFKEINSMRDEIREIKKHIAEA